jgi:hypothetical protein
MRTFGVALALALAWGTPAKASFTTGDELKKWCDDKSPACSAYVRGAVDDLLFRQIAAGEKKQMCLPEDIEVSQLVDIVARYLEAYPGISHWSAAILIHNALDEKYGCRTG